MLFLSGKNFIFCNCFVTLIYSVSALMYLASTSQSKFDMIFNSISCFASSSNFSRSFFNKNAGGFTSSAGAVTSDCLRSVYSSIVKCFRPFAAIKSIGCLGLAMPCNPLSEKCPFREFLRKFRGAAVLAGTVQNFFAPPTPQASVCTLLCTPLVSAASLPSLQRPCMPCLSCCALPLICL